MEHIVADIASGDQPVRAKLSLDAQIPFVYFSRLPAKCLADKSTSQGELNILVQRNREGISARVARPWIRQIYIIQAEVVTKRRGLRGRARGVKRCFIGKHP